MDFYVNSKYIILFSVDFLINFLARIKTPYIK